MSSSSTDNTHQPTPLEIAHQAERDLNSQSAKGTTKPDSGLSDSATSSGINESATKKFPGSTVTIGGQGAGDNREIPESEGGGVNPVTGRTTKAGDFEGVGGLEEKAEVARRERGGDDDV